jgi:hypothetical protein
MDFVSHSVSQLVSHSVGGQLVSWSIEQSMRMYIYFISCNLVLLFIKLFFKVSIQQQNAIAVINWSDSCIWHSALVKLLGDHFIFVTSTFASKP